MEIDLVKLLVALGRISGEIGDPNVIGDPNAIGDPDLITIGDPDVRFIGDPDAIGDPNLRTLAWLARRRLRRRPPWPPWPLGGFDPQPDPPGRNLLLASARVAHEIAMAAVGAEAAGSETASRIVSRAVDEWCGTAPPHLPVPWPSPWPFPWLVGYGGGDMSGGPDTDWDVQASRVVGGLSFASVASRLSEGEAREALVKGAEQLLQTALSG